MDEDHRKMFEGFMKKILEQPFKHNDGFRDIGSALAEHVLKGFQREHPNCSESDAARIILENVTFHNIPIDPVKDTPPRNLKEHFDSQPCYVEERIYMSEKTFEEFVGSHGEDLPKMTATIRTFNPKIQWSKGELFKQAELSGELIDVISSMREFLNVTVEDQVKKAMEIVQLKNRIAELEFQLKEAQMRLAFV